MQAYKYEDRFLINPGSATGAYSTITPDSNPSFVLMDINASKVYVMSSMSPAVLAPYLYLDCTNTSSMNINMEQQHSLFP